MVASYVYLKVVAMAINKKELYKLNTWPLNNLLYKDEKPSVRLSALFSSRT